jgi:hypothetical protein
MRPRPNVVIRLCTIECCFSHSLRECTTPATGSLSALPRRMVKGFGPSLDMNYVTRFPSSSCVSRHSGPWDTIRLFGSISEGRLPAGHLYQPNGELNELPDT